LTLPAIQPPLPPAATVIESPRRAPSTLEEFEAVLRRHDSATLALEEWCAARGIARPGTILAETLPPSPARSDVDLAATLATTPGETIALRNVALRCGSRVLSVAWNWYVPSRLTPDMNAALASTNIPFGKVVAPLGFTRQPLASVSGRAENCPAGTISTHRAMLVLPDGKPLAYLVECYTAANLALE